MAQTSGIQHIETVIRGVFEEGRCGEYYLVDLEITPTNRISVFIDGDEGVSLDACTQISRILQEVLDQEPTLGGIFELEVSSPGVNRSLKFPRQYIKHSGRTLRVTLENGTTVTGVLTGTNHETIALEVPPAEKKGKPELREIPFEEIREAYVTIQFGKSK